VVIQEVSFMANQEHLDILKQGVEVWNKWKRDNVVQWTDMKLLGDEYQAKQLIDKDGEEKTRDTQISEYQAADSHPAMTKSTPSHC
jgi:hypothetical protein